LTSADVDVMGLMQSHFPMYLNVKPANSSAPGNDGTAEFAQEAWWNAEQCEYEGHARNCTGGPAWAARQAEAQAKARSERPHYDTTSAPSASDYAAASNNANADLEPIFFEYGLDIYWAGVSHVSIRSPRKGTT
jgi:hypothetical protein